MGRYQFCRLCLDEHPILQSGGSERWGRTGAANGRIIYRALEVCATVEDFRHFLDTISKPSLIEANFGVIDAQGGAAVFEVDYYKYTMYDANNPKDAPYGYIARTNFSLPVKQIGGRLCTLYGGRQGTDEGFCNGRDHTAGYIQ